MKHIEHWESIDGKIFDTQEECERYEDLIKEITRYNVKLRDGSFLEGDAYDALDILHKYFKRNEYTRLDFDCVRLLYHIRRNESSLSETSKLRNDIDDVSSPTLKIFATLLDTWMINQR